MTELLRKFDILNGVKAKVLLEHRLFDSQVIIVDELHIIDDDERIGVRIKDQDIYINKRDIDTVKAYDKTFIVSDSDMTITIITIS